MSILQGNSCSIDQKSGKIWTVQTDLQQIYPKFDRLLGAGGFLLHYCMQVYPFFADAAEFDSGPAP